MLLKNFLIVVFGKHIILKLILIFFNRQILRFWVIFSIFNFLFFLFYTISYINRPPRLEDNKEDGSRTKQKGFRPLYDIPFMYEAREFLRKKLIGHNVQVGFWILGVML